MNKSSCSRIAQSLAGQGLIKSAPAASDSRRKVFTITDKGTTLIKKIDSVSNAAIDEYASRVTDAELKKLVLAMRRIADGYGHPVGVRRAGEPEYRVEQRRVTRCFGLLGDHVFGSELSSSQWQALSEIVLSPYPPRTNELADLLGLAQNSLSSIVDFLEKRRYVSRKSWHGDKRVTVLVPRREGIHAASVIEERAAQDLKHSLRDCSSAQVAEAVDILGRFVGDSDPLLPPLLPGYELAELVSAAERAAGRAFAVRSLVTQGLDNEIPETLVPQSARNFILSRDGEIECLIQIGGGQDGAAIEFGAWSANFTPWKFAGMINRIDFTCAVSVHVPLEKRVRFNPIKEFLAV